MILFSDFGTVRTSADFEEFCWLRRNSADFGEILLTSEKFCWLRRNSADFGETLLASGVLLTSSCQNCQISLLPFRNHPSTFAVHRCPISAKKPEQPLQVGRLYCHFRGRHLSGSVSLTMSRCSLDQQRNNTLRLPRHYWKRFHALKTKALFIG